ncbi:enoyl-CoA hydratase/isomerase family protein [Rhodococcus pseudokoreensis]|uniref:Enoyl-CoA hydratase/isomerase family protein n=1 Tax=Rhodococcus pseudokoreensis TaxID=2811421 RepID=A0A974W6Z8_9NOCA|nr:enoyl-CoA hydratase/isomerase family protein [Rhodococcus pseudokoreensis]QSE92453.1 enoyl-CoA hydratase/isomerase family protein [Rhodococcus pseudokoreensis]
MSASSQPEGTDVVRVRRHGSGRIEIELNRPGRKNALTIPMVTQLANALGDAQDDDAVTAVLLHGAGGCFSSGLDLAEVRPGEPAISAAIAELHARLAALEKPLVGALERAAVNGAAAIALACDLLVVGEKSFLLVGEAEMGVAAPNNLRWLLAKYGVNQALQLTLACERQYGPDLLRRGIAYAMEPDEHVLSRATELAEKMAAYPDGGGTAMKHAILAHDTQHA